MIIFENVQNYLFDIENEKYPRWEEEEEVIYWNNFDSRNIKITSYCKSKKRNLNIVPSLQIQQDFEGIFKDGNWILYENFTFCFPKLFVVRISNLRNIKISNFQ